MLKMPTELLVALVLSASGCCVIASPGIPVWTPFEVVSETIIWS